jgi:serine/threonine protein kinase
MKKNLPDINYFLGKEVPGFEGYTIVDYVASGCNGHVFKARNNEISSDVACKIIPKSNLHSQDKEYCYREAKNANTLRSRCVVNCLHATEYIDEMANIDCLVFCFQYIEGVSLDKFIKNNKKDITINFIEKFLKTIISFLYETNNKNIVHGDLHAGNVLVETAFDELMSDSPEFYVTDFGVGKTTYLDDIKDDFEHVAISLSQLLESICVQDLQNSRDRFSYNILNDCFLGKYLLETDKTIEPRARNPKLLLEELSSIDEQYKIRERDVEHKTLHSPFDYLSCEQIGDAHSILQALYSDKFISLSVIEERNNVILTGPRGCGKSTVYKSLSLYHKVLIEDATPDDINYIGIYYQCNDLYFAYPRFEKPKNTSAFDIPMHFFTSTLAIELLKTISIWSDKYYKREFSGEEYKISKVVWSEIFDNDVELDPSSYTFKALINRFEKERRKAAKKARLLHKEEIEFSNYFGPDILPKLCDILSRKLHYLSDRPIYFFIDDYSSPKISFELQKNLNRLVVQRTASCFFKISTESPVSYVSEDIDGKSFVEGREVVLVNLGCNYLNEEDETKLAFIEDVFYKRLNQVKDYPVNNITELLGVGDRKIGTEAANVYREGKKIDIYGKYALVHLCSGDIHYIINLVGRMVNYDGGIDNLIENRSVDKNKPIINSSLQSKVIREQAGNFLYSLQHSTKDGAALVKIVNAFGKVSHDYLLYKDSSNEGRKYPYQASRIEPHEAPQFEDEASRLYKELLRFSLFIEDKRGKSLRGNVVQRLYLRRCLIPHFKLTFSKRDSIKIDNKQFQMLLTNPDDFYSTMKPKKNKVNDTGLKDLFD